MFDFVTRAFKYTYNCIPYVSKYPGHIRPIHIIEENINVVFFLELDISKAGSYISLLLVALSLLIFLIAAYQIFYRLTGYSSLRPSYSLRTNRMLVFCYTATLSVLLGYYTFIFYHFNDKLHLINYFKIPNYYTWVCLIASVSIATLLISIYTQNKSNSANEQSSKSNYFFSTIFFVLPALLCIFFHLSLLMPYIVAVCAMIGVCMVFDALLAIYQISFIRSNSLSYVEENEKVEQFSLTENK